MFGLFKKKSEVEVLQKQYEDLMTKAYKLSKINRSESDRKYAEAKMIMDQIAVLKV